MTDLNTLQQALGVSFTDVALLQQALTHSSFVNENPDIAPTSNERLEFLGDAILSLIVAEKLHQDFPDYTEGEMTKLRAALVRRDTLVRMAKSIGLGEYLYLGKGEEASSGRSKPANLAAALEAVIAAIYLNEGLSSASKFVLTLIAIELEKAGKAGTPVDYKSELQETIQAQKQQAPSYHIIQITGPDHNRTFTVEVRLDKTVLGTGSGKNKKSAEAEAARYALQQPQNNFTP